MRLEVNPGLSDRKADAQTAQQWLHYVFVVPKRCGKGTAIFLGNSDRR